EVLPTITESRLPGGHRRPAHEAATVFDAHFAEQHRAPEEVPFHQNANFAVAETYERLLTTIGGKLHGGVTERFVQVNRAIQVERVENAGAADDPLLLVKIVHVLASPQQRHEVALHRGGFTHRCPGVQLNRDRYAGRLE